LLLDGREITATEIEVVETFLAPAAGEISENELAAWFREKSAEI
jgi:prophage maintenance system killer protein